MALLISCLVASGIGTAANTNPGDLAKPAAASPSLDKGGIPANILESLEKSSKTAAPPAPCNDPSCLSVSESDIKKEAELLKQDRELKAANAKKAAVTTPVIKNEGPNVSEPARLALRKSQEWAENPRALPSQGKDGRMVFTFGDSAPTIICAPLRVCDVELEPGEVVQGTPHIGDSVRWKISPAVSQEGDQKVTHLIIKPTEAGLDTNLMIPTDRRTYHLRLVSSRDQYLARVAFEYPDNNAPVWQKMMQSGNGRNGGKEAAPAPDLLPISVDRLYFNYKVDVVKGKPRFKPVRVMDDGSKTFISMNEDVPVEEAPILIMVEPDGSEQMVNYRLKGNIYTIDRMVEKVALITGTGSAQQKIEITRQKGCVKRGWFGRCIDGLE